MINLQMIEKEDLDDLQTNIKKPSRISTRRDKGIKISQRATPQKGHPPHMQAPTSPARTLHACMHAQNRQAHSRASSEVGSLGGLHFQLTGRHGSGYGASTKFKSLRGRTFSKNSLGLLLQLPARSPLHCNCSDPWSAGAGDRDFQGS